MSYQEGGQAREQVLLTTPEGVSKEPLQRFLNGVGGIDKVLRVSPSPYPRVLSIIPTIVKGLRAEQPLTEPENQDLALLVASLPTFGTGVFETTRSFSGKGTADIIVSQLPGKVKVINKIIDRVAYVTDEISTFENPREALQTDARKLVEEIRFRQAGNDRLSARDAASVVLSEEIDMITDPKRVSEAIGKYPFLVSLIAAMNESHLLHIKHTKQPPIVFGMVAQDLVSTLEKAAGVESSLSTAIFQEGRKRWEKVVDFFGVKGSLIGAIKEAPQVAEALAEVLPTTSRPMREFSGWLRKVNSTITSAARH